MFSIEDDEEEFHNEKNNKISSKKNFQPPPSPSLTQNEYLSHFHQYLTKIITLITNFIENYDNEGEKDDKNKLNGIQKSVVDLLYEKTFNSPHNFSFPCELRFLLYLVCFYLLIYFIF